MHLADFYTLLARIWSIVDCVCVWFMGLSRNECTQASKRAAIQGSMPIYLGALCTSPRREKCAPSCMKKSLFFHPPPGSAIRQTHPARARSFALCSPARRIQIKINTSLLDMQNRCFDVIGLAATNLVARDLIKLPLFAQQENNVSMNINEA